MVKGFLVGGLMGSLPLTTLLLALYALLARRAQLGDALLLGIAATLLGAGLGGVIGAVRAAVGRERWVLRPRARLASDGPGDQAPEPHAAPTDPRLRLAVAALYALASSTLGSLLVLGVGGRRDVTLLVGGLVPFDVTPVHARAMIAGTIFVGAFTVIAAASLRTGRSAPGLGRAEQRLVAAAGFVAGLLALPSLVVIFG